MNHVVKSQILENPDSAQLWIKDALLGTVTEEQAADSLAVTAPDPGVQQAVYRREDLAPSDLQVILVQVDVSKDDAGDNVVISVGCHDGVTYTQLAGYVPTVVPTTYETALLYSEDESALYPAFLFFFVGGQPATGRIGGVTFTLLNAPTSGLGYGRNYADGSGAAPDNQSVHANHTITYDAPSGRLKITATGAGSSYITWTEAFSNENESAYLEISGMTATGQVMICEENGVDFGSIRGNANGKFSHINQASNSNAAIGLQITTTSAGDIYIDRWGYIKHLIQSA